jgi:hypothetical protein
MALGFYKGLKTQVLLCEWVTRVSWRAVVCITHTLLSGEFVHQEPNIRPARVGAAG